MFNNLKRCIGLLLAAAALASAWGCAPKGSDRVSKSFFAFNTICTITLYGTSDDSAILGCQELCLGYEQLFSRTIETSEISRLNSREIDSLSPETARLLSLALEYAKLSRGAFDPTVEPVSSLWDFTAQEPKAPDKDVLSRAAMAVDYTAVSLSGTQVDFSSPDTRLDLGGIAKGYAADRLREYLLDQGVESAIINLGGNVLCVGDNGGEPFGVGIQKPFSQESVLTVRVSDCSVVTSGVYQRCFERDGVLYHHILDPETGVPVQNGLLSVTIVGRSSARADALSTACFVLGPQEGMELVDSLEGVYGIFILDDYTILYSSGACAALGITQ